MSCPFARDDGAYVLGALSPGERVTFERHLAGCAECARSVRELAGLPGLLGRVDVRVLEQGPDGGPPPESLLPELLGAVRRARRRGTVVVAALAAGAAAVLVVAVVVPLTLRLTAGGEGGPVGAPPSSTAPAGAVAEEMVPLGEVPVRASLTLERAAWGTRLALECTYDPASVDYELPPEVDYLLVVRTRDGRTERVGSWRSVGGTTMRLLAATAAEPQEITSVEVRTPGGRVVLELAV